MKDKEVELRFVNIDADKIRTKLKKLGAKVYQPKYKMKIWNYKYKDYRVRIRDEGKNKTFTIKTNLKEKYPTEYEIKIDNMDQAHKMILLMGCKEYYKYEKYREFWHMDGAKEIVIDELPGLESFVEVDCHDEANLFKICRQLGLDPENDYNNSDGQMYIDKYGIKRGTIIMNNISFDNAEEVFEKHINKNKDDFFKILKKQRKYD
jgi:predicted adenylyl cyclase CyaB